MEINRDNLNSLYDYVVNMFTDIYKKYNNNPIVKDKFEHINNMAKFAKLIDGDNFLLLVSMLFHDIGRFPQFELIGNFNDRLVSHHVLGEDLIGKEIASKKLVSSSELDLIRLIVLYHGKEQLVPNKDSLTPEMIKLLNDVSQMDGIENGCIGAIGYLGREVYQDAKGYRASNPNLDMKSVSPEVLTYFLDGVKFDKMICKTYAEYILFASVLAIQGLKGEHRDLAKMAMEMPCYGYQNALYGYADIFDQYVDPAISKLCFNTLYKFYLGDDNKEINVGNKRILKP
mgnify:CR=1 FL=1